MIIAWQPPRQAGPKRPPSRFASSAPRLQKSPHSVAGVIRLTVGLSVLYAYRVPAFGARVSHRREVPFDLVTKDEEHPLFRAVVSVQSKAPRAQPRQSHGRTYHTGGRTSARRRTPPAKP